MRVLALETATPAAGAALVDDGQILAECQLAGQKNHSERLLQITHSLFEWTGAEKRSVDLIAVSVGPGSFTGLRVGISTAQGLAFALDRPLAGIPTLDVVASQAAMADGFVSPMVDARKHQVYAALYHARAGGLTQVQPPTVVDPAQWVESLDGPAMLIGNGVSAYSEAVFSAAKDKGCSMADQNLGIPRASTVARLAGTIYAASACRPELVSAMYVRAPDAFVHGAAAGPPGSCHGQ